MKENSVEKQFDQLVHTLYLPPEGESGECIVDAQTGNQALITAWQFIQDHKAFVLEDKRYMEFVGLLVLLNPATYSFYYVLLDAMVDLAKETKDVQALTDISKSLELIYNPINITVIKSNIHTLLEWKAYKHAAELCEYLSFSTREYPISPK